MNCNGCGAAMELYAARGYFFCKYCGSFHFPESAGPDGIRIVGDDSRQLDCPVCAKRLASAMLDERHPVNYCRHCRGVLLPRSAFAAAVTSRRAWATGPPAPPVPLRREELNRTIGCPACRTRMTTHPYYGPGNIVMDSCDACNAVWLDFGELRQIVDAPGSDRGTREAAGPGALGFTSAAPASPASPSPIGTAAEHALPDILVQLVNLVGRW